MLKVSGFFSGERHCYWWRRFEALGQPHLPVDGMKNLVSPPPNVTSLTNPMTCTCPVFAPVFYVNQLLIQVFHSIDQKIRLTKGLKTLSSITLLFTAEKPRDLQHNRQHVQKMSLNITWTWYVQHSSLQSQHSTAMHDMLWGAPCPSIYTGPIYLYISSTYKWLWLTMIKLSKTCIPICEWTYKK